MAAVIFCRGLFYFVSSFLLTRLDSCPKKTVYGIKIIMRHGVTGMAQYADFEKLCCDIAVMSKREVKNRLLHFPGRLKLDFTEDYLDGLTVERLRHILLAALMVDMRKHA